MFGFIFIWDENERWFDAAANNADGLKARAANDFPADSSLPVEDLANRDVDDLACCVVDALDEPVDDVVDDEVGLDDADSPPDECA
jgi:hypothetical protein